MLITPYSIYVNKRPLRIAFLIENTHESLAILDVVLADNRSRWGGRYNPIILTDGQGLTYEWWRLLDAIDPDIIKSFVTLSDNLVAEIHRRISPLLIQQPDRSEMKNGYRSLYLHNPGISILPTKSNIKMASWGIRESCLVLFETDSERTDSQIKQFVEWNFGTYSSPSDAVTHALAGVGCSEYYPLTDATSLAESLTALSSHRNFTYPIQLCSIPKESLYQVDYDRLHEIFHVVIGDSPEDVAYYWNRPSITPQQSRTHLNQIWMPVSIASNSQLTAAICSWLQRWADPIGNGQGNIRFVSLSLPLDQLQEIVRPLTCNLHLWHQVETLSAIQAPTIANGNTRPPNKSEMDLYRGSSNDERINLQEPDILQGTVLNEYWMNDIYIEFRPEKNPYSSENIFWWQLPRLNELAVQMFNRPSRILRSRYPSILMMRGASRLRIVLPDDMQLFIMLTCMTNQGYDVSDARHNKNLLGRSPYYHAQRSDKGRYLSGIVELFGGLEQAKFIFEERFWRNIFNVLSGKPADKEANQFKEVKNAMIKHFKTNPAKFYESDKEMEWLSEFVLNFAHRLPLSSRDIDFHIFEEYAQKEVSDFNSSHPGTKQKEYSKPDLITALGGLTEKGVLLMGITAKCPTCGYRDWHHIDNVKQTLSCGGCNITFPIKPEIKWQYRLNSLVRVAYSEHGLLPVVLVLGQLLMKAESAFVFAPCLDLFETMDGRSVGDLDIALVIDGKFVIGEIKESLGRFDPASFVTIENIARRLLPDAVIFSSLDREPNDRINREIARLADVLRPLHIAVSWYPLEGYIFDPCPVM